MQISYFIYGADLAGSFIAKNYILSQDNIMLYDMHSHIINAHIGIRIFHTIAIFFEQAKSTFYSCTKRLQFFIDYSIRSSRTKFTVAISKICIRDKSASVNM